MLRQILGAEVSEHPSHGSTTRKLGIRESQGQDKIPPDARSFCYVLEFVRSIAFSEVVGKRSAMDLDNVSRSTAD
jgi:hypothetical protein